MANSVPLRMIVADLPYPRVWTCRPGSRSRLPLERVADGEIVTGWRDRPARAEEGTFERVAERVQLRVEAFGSGSRGSRPPWRCVGGGTASGSRSGRASQAPGMSWREFEPRWAEVGGRFKSVGEHASNAVGSPRYTAMWTSRDRVRRRLGAPRVRGSGEQRSVRIEAPGTVRAPAFRCHRDAPAPCCNDGEQSAMLGGLLVLAPRWQSRPTVARDFPPRWSRNNSRPVPNGSVSGPCRVAGWVQNPSLSETVTVRLAWRAIGATGATVAMASARIPWLHPEGAPPVQLVVLLCHGRPDRHVLSGNSPPRTSGGRRGSDTGTLRYRGVQRCSAANGPVATRISDRAGITANLSPAEGGGLCGAGGSVMGAS